MAITADQKYLLNNKMGRVANKVQLGTLIEGAESVVASEIALADGKIFVGNASNLAEAQTMSGDVTVTNGGVAAIAAGVIVNADVSASAAIAFSKLAALTDGNVLIGNGSNVATSVAVTGDVTISNSGVTAIAAGVIVNADVGASAAIDYSKLAALTSANILVGSAGNVATSVAMSGDITISNTGVTAIGAAKVLASMISGVNGAVKVQRFTVGFAALNTAGTGVAALFGSALPDNAVISQVWYDVTTTFVDAGTAGDADSSTIKVGIEDQDNDTVVAVAISDGGNPWDSGIHAGIEVGTAATMIKLTAARQLAVTWTAGTGDATSLTAGAMEVFVEYVEST